MNRAEQQRVAALTPSDDAAAGEATSGDPVAGDADGPTDGGAGAVGEEPRPGAAPRADA